MTRVRLVIGVVLCAVGLIAFVAGTRRALGESERRPVAARSTSESDLAATIGAMSHRLERDETDAQAAVTLADALLRLARVESDASHAVEAEQVLTRALRHEPGEYTALKMLGAVYLSQHRFRDALDVARRAAAVRDDDAWNLGVMGDAYLELGEYERAFEAFDRMARRRPDAAAYARVAYAHEVQGRLDAAATHMRRAAEATSAHDPESLAWHHTQLAHLALVAGDLERAGQEYARADFIFPGHPYARIGLARVAAARRDYARALGLYRAELDDAPTPEIAAAVGDILAVTGDAGGAAAMYQTAEALEREGWQREEPQPAALARLLAERALKPAEAVALAERAAQSRADIATCDALALAYFRAGRLEEASAAARRALRTGTRDPRILYHAAAIAHAREQDEEARTLLARIPDSRAAGDVLVEQGITALRAKLSEPSRQVRRPLSISRL